MSRVAKMPVALPKGVECTVTAEGVTVKGPKGTLKLFALSGVGVVVKDNQITFQSSDANDTKMAGTARALVNNMVKGVSQGYERKLELVGVGYRAAMAGKDLNLTLGFSHPLLFKAPEGVSLETPTQTEILIKGADKQRVGETAAKIRAFRPPEPYKGKGVRYSGEKITLKEAKKA
jgi:large subunit ribosomal protein L6